MSWLLSCMSGWVGCAHVQHSIHYSSSIPEFFLYRNNGPYTFRICSQSHSRMRLLLVTVMDTGTFLAAVSHRSDCLLLSLHACSDATGIWPNGNNTASPHCQSSLVSIFIVQWTCHPALPPQCSSTGTLYLLSQCVVSTDKHVWRIGTCYALYIYCSWYPYIWDLWSLSEHLFAQPRTAHSGFQLTISNRSQHTATTFRVTRSYCVKDAKYFTRLTDTANTSVRNQPLKPWPKAPSPNDLYRETRKLVVLHAWLYECTALTSPVPVHTALTHVKWL